MKWLFVVIAVFVLIVVVPLFGYDRISWHSKSVNPVDANKEAQDIYHKMTTHRALIDSLFDLLDDATTDCIFYAYDSVAGNRIGSLDFAYLTIDTEVRKNSCYTHDDTSSFVTIKSSGWYRVDAQATALAKAGTAGSIYLSLYGLNGSGSAQALPADAYASCAISVVHEFDVDDSIAVYMYNLVVADSVITQPGSVRLLIEKLD